MRQYIVDAFTNKIFSGNPAAVCVMDKWPEETWMMQLAAEKICVFESDEIVRDMNPEQSLLMKIEGRIQNATAKGTDIDCVSRSFCPKLAISEDPVCGSAHCQIVDYWSKELNKDTIIAYQASKRGGTLHCHMTGNGRIKISGEAVLFAISEIQI